MQLDMRTRKAMGLAICAVIIFAAGCRKTLDKSDFKSAINSYYSSRQVCVWSSPIKFPAQADTSNDEQTKGFDALTDAGMLTRSSAEKKRFLIGSKQVNNYDLSDKGRSSWTADQTQPGYGNFCFGHREVTSVDAYTPADNPDATQYAVTYHYDVTGVPDWAKSAEMQTAFPRIAADISGQQIATATVVKTSNGWQVQSVQPASGGSALPQ
jgi:hypothetical protein